MQENMNITLYTTTNTLFVIVYNIKYIPKRGCHVNTTYLLLYKVQYLNIYNLLEVFCNLSV